MKNYIKTITKAIRGVSKKAKTTLKSNIVSTKFAEQKGQFVMDNAVVFVIILVVAAIAITLLVSYLEGDFSSLITGKINAFFN